MKIGNVELENNIFLAPMAGITDLAYRSICKEFGAGLTYSEMVSAKGLYFHDEKTKKLTKRAPNETPFAIQIFGSDGDIMADVAQKLSDEADIIDINMGCPAPKVVKNGDGSKLLLDLEQAKKVMKSVVKNSNVPVTLKIRTGWDKENIVAVDIAKIAEDVGISAITVHGRTRSEFYTGKSDWDIIKKVKENVNIPVIGNGDVIDEESAKKMFEYTNVDGIMIGRGALGNPWIFREIIHFLKTGEKLEKPSNSERLEIMKKHIKLAIDEKGDIAIKELRKHIAWYTKNLKNSSDFRSSINKIEDEKELIKTLDEYFASI